MKAIALLLTLALGILVAPLAAKAPRGRPTGSEFWVRVPTQLGSSLSVSRAEFLGFVREGLLRHRGAF
jgi:hypothetical protein